MSGRAVVVGEYAGADGTIHLRIDDKVDIIKKSDKWWYVGDGQTKGYFPAICLRELDLSELPPLPTGWSRNVSSDNRVYYYNESTGSSQWHYPKGVPPPPPPPRRPAAPMSPLAGPAEHREPSVAAPHPAPLPACDPPRVSSLDHHDTSPGFAIAPPNSVNIRLSHTPHSSVDYPLPVRTPVGPYGNGTHLLRDMDQLGLSASFDIEGEKQLPAALKEDIEKFSIRGFANEHFNSHMRWTLFQGRKKLQPEEVLSFSKGGIKQSLTKLSKRSQTFAIRLYGQISVYVDSEKERARCNTASLPEGLLHDILASIEEHARADHFIIDEAFCQVIKQCTNNPSASATELGWRLMYGCFLCFSPSRDLVKYLYKQSRRASLSLSAAGGFAIGVNKLCLLQLQHINSPPHKIRVSEVSEELHLNPLAAYHIPEKLYGCRLECVKLWEANQIHQSEGSVALDRDSIISRIGRDDDQKVDLSEHLPTLSETLSTTEPPMLLLHLCDAVIRLGAANKPGIFREAANVDAVKHFVAKVESGDLQCIALAGLSGTGPSSSDVVTDVLVACDMLKIWFRRLPDPIVSYQFYDQCISAGLKGDSDVAYIILDSMDPLHKATLQWLCRFLRYLSRFSSVTKMDISNLCLVFAPNCIKNPNGDDMAANAMNAEREKRCLQLFVDLLSSDLDEWPPS